MKNGKFMQSAYKIKWIEIRNLSVIWAQAQRDFKPAWADEIAEKFDPDMFDAIVVTLPDENGSHHVVDGQHRCAALAKLYGINEKCPCRVVEATSPERAAAIFDQINNGRKHPSQVEKFNVRVTAGNDVELDISRIVTFIGYRISASPVDGSIRAVGTLYKIYNAHGAEILRETLVTIRGIWGDDRHGLDGPILHGFANLIAAQRAKLDWDRLRKQTAKTFTPARLIGAARSAREFGGGSMAKAVTEVLANNYNKGLRGSKLET